MKILLRDLNIDAGAEQINIPTDANESELKIRSTDLIRVTWKQMTCGIL